VTFVVISVKIEKLFQKIKRFVLLWRTFIDSLGIIVSLSEHCCTDNPALARNKRPADSCKQSRQCCLSSGTRLRSDYVCNVPSVL